MAARMCSLSLSRSLHHSTDLVVELKQLLVVKFNKDIFLHLQTHRDKQAMNSTCSQARNDQHVSRTLPLQLKRQEKAVYSGHRSL